MLKLIEEFADCRIFIKIEFRWSTIVLDEKSLIPIFADIDYEIMIRTSIVVVVVLHERMLMMMMMMMMI